MRVILVPLSGEPHDGVALAAAYSVARRFRSHIEGLFVRPDPMAALGAFEGIPPEMVGTVTRSLGATWNERAERARAAFDAARASADVPVAGQPTGTDTVSARWRDVAGADDDLLIGHGRLADLVVFAGVRSETNTEQRRRFVNVMFNGARPVLMVPLRGQPQLGRSVALAWNGSAEAARALSGAMPLLINAEEVHVLTAATPRTRAESGDALKEYLAWHGVIAEVHPMYPEASVGEALLQKTKDLDADVLVMGGYGRSRFREWVFGGVTRHVLGHYDRPLLISH